MGENLREEEDSGDFENIDNLAVRSHIKICECGASAVGAQGSTHERKHVDMRTVRTSTSGLP